MSRRTRIYIDHFPESASDRIHVPAMGVHELMPPGFIRHGGAGSQYPCLIMIFHSPAYCLSPDQTKWLPAQDRLVVWSYEAAHCYGNADEAWDHSWMRISGHWINRVLRQTPVPLGVPLELGDDRSLRYLKFISDELRSDCRQDADTIEGLAQAFWSGVERRVNAGSVSRCHDPRLERARRYIEIHFDRPFSLAETAAQAHLSPPHFCSLFSRQFGVPPREYAMRLRLQRGAQLLANPSLAVFEVAEMIGCPDALYFSRLFRKRYGLSPVQFRSLQHAKRQRRAGNQRPLPETLTPY